MGLISLGANGLTVGGLLLIGLLLLFMGILLVTASRKVQDVINFNNSVRGSENLANAEANLRTAYYMIFIAAGLVLLLIILYLVHDVFWRPSEWLHAIIYLLIALLVIVGVFYAYSVLSNLYHPNITNRNGADAFIWASLVVGVLAFIIVMVSGTLRMGYAMFRGTLRRYIRGIMDIIRGIARKLGLEGYFEDWDEEESEIMETDTTDIAVEPAQEVFMEPSLDEFGPQEVLVAPAPIVSQIPIRSPMRSTLVPIAAPVSAPLPTVVPTTVPVPRMGLSVRPSVSRSVAPSVSRSVAPSVPSTFVRPPVRRSRIEDSMVTVPLSTVKDQYVAEAASRNNIGTGYRAATVSDTNRVPPGQNPPRTYENKALPRTNPEDSYYEESGINNLMMTSRLGSESEIESQSELGSESEYAVPDRPTMLGARRAGYPTVPLSPLTYPRSPGPAPVNI